MKTTTKSILCFFLAIVCDFAIIAVGHANPPNYTTWALPDGAIARLGKGGILQDHQAVAYLPDGKGLAVATAIGMWLYNVESHEEIALFAHKSGVFSPDGKTIAGAGQGGTVKLWSVETGQEIAVLEGHSDGVESIAFSPDGQIIASGSRDKTVKLWSVKDKQELATFEGHESWI